MLTFKIILTMLLTLIATSTNGTHSTDEVCRNGYCVTRRVSDTEALASDCNPARKDPPSPKAPTPPKDAPPPGGYNPKV